MNTIYNWEFGKKLQQLRIEAGYKSQRQFGLAVGISSASISRIEAGKQRIEPESLEKIAPFVNKSYKELMKLAGYINWER